MTDPTTTAWEIEEGITDAAHFFGYLPNILPSATVY